MSGLLRRALNAHWLITLVLMGVFGLLFGLCSLNIVFMLRANLDLVGAHGTMALLDGALQQLAELIGYGYLSTIFYVLFKACERILVEKALG